MRWLVAALLILLALPAWATTALRVDWGASTDPGGTGVFKYNVYRLTGSCGVPSVYIGSSTTNTYFDTTTAASTTYCYSVSAVDESGNESAKTVIGSKQSLAYTTRAATTNSLADVNTAVAAAVNGDLVTIPIGSAHWTTWLNLPTDRGITLQCASVTTPPSCHIFTDAVFTVVLPGWTSENDLFYRISGIDFSGNGGTQNGPYVEICSNGGCVGHLRNMRIDHNNFALSGGGKAMQLGDESDAGTIYGVIDHNTMTSSTESTFYYENDGKANPPNPFPMGTASNLFAEDNTITIITTNGSTAGCMDGWGNNDSVFRYNTFTNCQLTSHGMTHAGGPQSQEVYGNSFVMNSGSSGAGIENGCYRCYHHQGSGGVAAYDNIFTAFGTKQTEVISVLHYCDYSFCTDSQQSGTGFTATIATTTMTVTSMNGGPSNIVAGLEVFGTGVTNPSIVQPGGAGGGVGTYTLSASSTVTTGETMFEGPICDGTRFLAQNFTSQFNDGGSDGNRSPTSTYFGYPCWHQPGRSFETSPAGGVLRPIYIWNNQWSDTLAQIPPLIGGPCGVCLPPDLNASHLQEKRDYYLPSTGPQTTPTSPFDGSYTGATGGVGWGTFARRPTSCSTGLTDAADAGFGGVGYFATDKGPRGVLYRCGVTNTWTIHYQPYAQFNDGVTPNCTTNTPGACRHPLTAIP